MKNRFLTDDEAVSPVIATILMVAITVVLAATLYMMLPDTPEHDTITGTFGDTEELDGGKYKLKFASLSQEKSVAQLRFRLENSSSGEAVFFEYNSHPSSSPYEITKTSGDYTLKYVDIGGDQVVSTGDYLVVSDGIAQPGLDGSYELTVLNEGNQVMSTSFTV